MQRSSNSDVAAWFISRKVLGIRGKKGECESPTDDMVRISCSHLLGSLVICRITKYQPDKPLLTGHPFGLVISPSCCSDQTNPTNLVNISLQPGVVSSILNWSMTRKSGIKISLLKMGSWDDPVCGLEIGLEYRA